MNENPFKNQVESINDGYKNYDSSERINLGAVEEKRDEYLANAVNEVVKKYDQSKITEISKFINKSEQNESQKLLLNDLVSDVRNYLCKEHGINILNLSPNGTPDVIDKKIINDINEMEATYPDEMIKDFVKVWFEIGHL